MAATIKKMLVQYSNGRNYKKWQYNTQMATTIKMAV